MAAFLPIILTFSLIVGQLVKLPSGTQGLTVLDLAVLGLDAAALISLKFRLKKPPAWLAAAFTFIAVAAASLAISPLHLTATQKFFSFTYTLRLLAYFLLGWTLESGALKPISQQTGKIFIYSGLGLAALGLLQLAFLPDLRFLAAEGWDPHYFRSVSTFLDPNFLGAYLALILLFFLRDFSSLKKSRMQQFFFLIIYTALVTTFSRSAAIAFLVSFSAFSLLQKSWRLAALTLVLLLGFGLGFGIYHQAIAQPRNIDRQQSAGYRLGSWETGLKLFQSAPVLGVGFNAYRFALQEYQLVPPEVTKSHGGSSNDSSLLFVAATTGVIGLFAYLMHLGLLFQAGVRNHLRGKISGAVLIAGLCGLLVNSFFINSLFYPFLLIWIILLAANLNFDTA